MLVLAIAAFAAGVQNALAGGGSFLTLPALLLTGLDARVANVTSTVALFPAQVTTGLAGRHEAAGTGSLTLTTLSIISLSGGAVGAWVLLATPPTVFTVLLPWLVLSTTLIFAWGNFCRPERGGAPTPGPGPVPTGLIQFAIAAYGGYFGGGIGILMLAVLTLSGLPLRTAAATKNILSGVINSSAVLIFLFSRDVAWREAWVVAAAATAGGRLGVVLLNRVNERILRSAIVLTGLALTVGLVIRHLGL